MFRKFLNVVGFGVLKKKEKTRFSDEFENSSTSSEKSSNVKDLNSDLDLEFSDEEKLEKRKNLSIQSNNQSNTNATNLPHSSSFLPRFVTVDSVETDSISGELVKIIVGKDGNSLLKILFSNEILTNPKKGDKLIFRQKNEETRGLLVPESLEFARTRNNVLVRVTGHHESHNGQKFIFFEKKICCDSSEIPVGASTQQGALFKVNVVESKQPKNHIWRAYLLEMVNPSIPREVPEDMLEIKVDPQLEFDPIPFGATVSKSISIRNVDSENRWTLVRMSVLGLPLKLVGPIHISEPHITDDTPSGFHPSIDFYPFKRIELCFLSSQERQITIRVVGIFAGNFDFSIRFDFREGISRTCHVTAKILQSDGTEFQDIMPEIAPPRRHRDIARNLCRQEATERLKSMVTSQRLAGIVPSPRITTLEDDKIGGWSPIFRAQFLIPEELMDILNDPDLTMETVLQKHPVLGQPLNIENYASKFHFLLFLEEHFELVVVRNYDLVSNELTAIEGSATYRLKMENLQEQRPSLVRGDLVSVRNVIDDEGPRYQARIVKVGMESIDLCFDEKFDSYFKQNLSLEFSFLPNRNYFRRIHNILNLAERNLSRRLFFPDLKNRDRCIKRVKDSVAGSEELNFVNQNLNDQQRQGVKMVVVGRCQPMAHVIFGPPGTGKTVTVVEAVIQIFLRNSKSRILVCAPSNAATDLIGQKLIESKLIPADAIRRILCVQRNLDTVPQILAESVQTGCTEQLAKNHRIILTTCFSASFFVEFVQDFTHVFVDESGFATEPEILVPLAAVAGRPDVQIVLAGDPNQLGPVVCSTFAKELGLEKSLLSRLLELPAYSEWTDDFGKILPFCPFLVTKLELNYRSVESLLKIPSKLFYNCELKSQTADDQNIYAPRLGLPALTFWPVNSLEFRESRSPSIANPGQVKVVCQLTENLLTVGMTPENIGIITPYRLQAEHIRKALLTNHLPVPKIGTVEEFQGQERDAIILSTVRARRRFNLDIPVKDILGFVACPKRTNVALTRARFILMLVGDPHVLALDKYWKGILRYCCAKDLYQKDLYRECDFPPPNCVSGIEKNEEKLRERQVPVIVLEAGDADSSDSEDV